MRVLYCSQNYERKSNVASVKREEALSNVSGFFASSRDLNFTNSSPHLLGFFLDEALEVVTHRFTILGINVVMPLLEPGQ
jgi:hypothetical protein